MGPGKLEFVYYGTEDEDRDGFKNSHTLPDVDPQGSFGRPEPLGYLCATN